LHEAASRGEERLVDKQLGLSIPLAEGRLILPATG